MTTSAISGTILASQFEGDKTVIRLATGGNGNKREENVVLPGRKEITSGNAVRLVNFIRADDGALVPGEQAKLSIVRQAPAEAPSAVSPVEPPTATVAQQEAIAPALPAPPLTAPPPPAIIPTAVHHGGIMAFSDKRTRRAVFNRAVEVAREFAEHIRRARQVVTLDGRPYVTVAGWALLPAFESAQCYPASVRLEPDGTVVAEAYVEKNGQVVSHGFGACSPEETIFSKKKGTIVRKRPILNDRMAMAQTRARGAALKSRYAVLVTLAGYEAAIADEVSDATATPDATVPPADEDDQPEPVTRNLSTSASNRASTPRQADAQPATPAPKPTAEQIEFALKMFDGDTQALLAAAANLGLLVFSVNDITTPVLKRIVEQRVIERKNRRAEAAAQAA